MVQPVPAGTELLVWYGDSYTRELGIRVQKHQVTEETGREGVRCGHCHTLFSSKEDLAHHYSPTGGADKKCFASRILKKWPKKFPCTVPQCKSVFMKARDMENHIRWVHDEVKDSNID